MTKRNWFRLNSLVLILLFLTTLTAAASPLSDEQNLSVTTEQIKLPGTIDGKAVELAAMVYRPAGVSTPRPAIILTHGRRGHSPSRNAKEVESSSGSCNALAKKGFVVVYLVRSGYGTSVGPDFEGGASSSAYKLGLAGAKSIQVAVKSIRQLPYVDPQKIVVGGLSVGGLSTMAAAGQNLEGVVGYVNFAGFPVNLNQLEVNHAFAQYGKTAKNPSLWLYSSGDQFLKFIDIYTERDHFVKVGGQCTLKMTRYVNNGHLVINRPDDWLNYLDSYLDTVGLAEPFK